MVKINDVASPMTTHISTNHQGSGQNNTTVNMQTPRTPSQIAAEGRIQILIDTYKAQAQSSNAQIQESAKKILEVYDKVDYTVNSDGSVFFTFKDNVNVEDFKQAFGMKDGVLRKYLKNRHDEGLNNGTVREYGDLTEYYNSGKGARVNYSDGFVMERRRNSNWFTFTPLVDYPIYTGMSFGPEDNENLRAFSSNCFKKM